MAYHRIFVASLGNPSAAYKDTLHSAAHTVIEGLHEMLFIPPFRRDRLYGKGLLATGHQVFTLWQSPSFMNESGKSLVPAWKAFLKDLNAEERTMAKLVILHDDLEGHLGKVTVKDGKSSSKGHNGIKDCIKKLQGTEFTKIGIGIGRPVSRQSLDVAAYVLRKMKPEEKEKVYDARGPVLKALNDLSEV